MKSYISKLNDPYTNLAVEHWLFRTSPFANVLFMYRNSASVVIGRNQNPWKEVHFNSLQTQSIPLVRRHSGGGTVWHDLGNTNYCAIMDRADFKRETSVNMVNHALHQLDIPSQVNSRYDIEVGDCKVSGSAYKITNERSYHHGTMLIDSDLTNISKVLTKKSNLITGGGIDSVRAKVGILRDYSFTIDHSSFCEAVVKQFHKLYGGSANELITIDESFVNETQAILDFRDELVVNYI